MLIPIVPEQAFAKLHIMNRCLRAFLSVICKGHKCKVKVHIPSSDHASSIYSILEFYYRPLMKSNFEKPIDNTRNILLIIIKLSRNHSPHWDQTCTACSCRKGFLFERGKLKLRRGWTLCYFSERNWVSFLGGLQMSIIQDMSILGLWLSIRHPRT